MVIGALVYYVMILLGEMAAWLPILESLTHFASRFIDDSTSITVGYSYLTHMEIPSVFNASLSNGQVNNMYIRTITKMEKNKSKRIRKQ
jgi:amino acid permease